MQSYQTALLCLLRRAIGESTDTPVPPLSEAEERSLYDLARSQDVAAIAAVELEKLGRLPQGTLGNRWENQRLTTLYRSEQQRYECCRIAEAFTARHIPFIFLKGATLSAFYPEAWMRIGMDLDVLVGEKDYAEATAVLTDVLGYESGVPGLHDRQFRNENQVVELHFSLRRNLLPTDTVLDRAWDYAHPLSADTAQWAFSPEFLVFYQIAHLTSHFKNGGCGIRPVLDLWVLRHSLPWDNTVLAALLEEGGLSAVADHTFALSEVWFSGADGTAVTEDLGHYILEGKRFGTLRHVVALKQGSTHTSGVGYLWHRLFPSYREMTGLFPILVKRAWLLPLYYPFRWTRVLSDRSRRRSTHETALAFSVSKDESETVARLAAAMELPHDR